MSEPTERGRSDLWRLAPAAAIVVVLGLFVLDNRRSVRVGFIVADRDISLIWVLVVTALLGAVADRLARRRRHR
ncbi:MAG: hypothetical protein ACRD0D_02125 [Acidimicrobiales bacterium]